jgi:hypothetical protein
MSLDREGHKLAVAEFWQNGIILDLDKPARPLLLKHPRVKGIALKPRRPLGGRDDFQGGGCPNLGPVPGRQTAAGEVLATWGTLF